jgi:hypothetical protein
MADPTPTPPAPTDWFSRQSPFVRHVLAAVFTVALSLAVTYAAGKLGVTVPSLPTIPVEQLAGPPPSAGAMGWVNDPDAVAAVRSALPAGERFFGDTPAGKALHGNDGTVLLSDKVKQVLGRHLPARDQGQVGCCVSFGTGTAVDYLQLCQMAEGAALEFKAACNEAIYGGSRKQIGGGRIRGDGSVTAWAGDWVKRYGVVPREKIGQYDLTAYSEGRARSWGQSGCPADLEPVARESPVKGIAFARTADEVAKAVRQRYTVAVGSQVGFGAVGPYHRDKDGFLKANGSWGHCQAILGVRDDSRRGFLIVNSWGPNWVDGPTGGYDLPDGSYWVDWATVDRMAAEGDCVVFSDATGWPARKIDWFADARPAPRKKLAFDTPFALAP